MHFCHFVTLLFLLDRFCFLDSVLGEGEEGGVGVNGSEVAVGLFGDDSCRATAAK